MKIIRPEHSRWSFVDLSCLAPKIGHCQFRLSREGPMVNAGCVWGWDGSEEAPTITPSIACQACGLHVVISAGVETGNRKAE